MPDLSAMRMLVPGVSTSGSRSEPSIDAARGACERDRLVSTVLDMSLSDGSNVSHSSPVRHSTLPRGRGSKRILAPPIDTWLACTAKGAVALGRQAAAAHRETDLWTESQIGPLHA